MKAALIVGLLPLMAWAANPPGNVTSFDGVTKDGRYLLWSGQDDYETPPETVVQDLLTGAQTVFEQEGDKLTAWKSGHPIVPIVAGRFSPDKKAVADIVAVEAGGDGSWVGERWSNGSATLWSLVVTRGGEQHVVAHCEPVGSIDVYWTPDGKRTLWVAHHSGHAMRDPGFSVIIVGTDGNPGVALAVDKPKLKDADKLSATLAKAGFTVLSVTAAKKAREKSVVFAAAGHEADAKRLAAAVPGGAEVQKLDWQSQVELVLALGPDATK